MLCVTIEIVPRRFLIFQYFAITSPYITSQAVANVRSVITVIFWHQFSVQKMRTERSSHPEKRWIQNYQSQCNFRLSLLGALESDAGPFK